MSTLNSRDPTEPAPKRPINCGTGHCSCIECVMEPAPSKLGMKIIVDESLPADELRIVQNGKTVGAVTNIAASSTAGERKTPVYAEMVIGNVRALKTLLKNMLDQDQYQSGIESMLDAIAEGVEEAMSDAYAEGRQDQLEQDDASQSAQGERAEVIELLKQVAAISRDRGINFDFAKIADRAAALLQSTALPDPQLCKFYGVETYPELVAIMLRHIEKLQAKLPPTSDEQPRKARFA